MRICSVLRVCLPKKIGRRRFGAFFTGCSRTIVISSSRNAVYTQPLSAVSLPSSYDGVWSGELGITFFPSAGNVLEVTQDSRLSNIPKDRVVIEGTAYKAKYMWT